MDPKLLPLIALVATGVAWWALKRRPDSLAKPKGDAKDASYVHDLSTDAEQGKLQPAIGREDEIDRVINIIRRKLKNNPLLIGEPGVGKTAVVEGLALRIARKEVPPELQDTRVLSLSLADMLAGTSFRGELEQRIKKFTDELEAMGDKKLLFIDEIHMIHQVKGVEGGLNLSDMLKPALARGKLAVIGATTWHEFRDSLQKDPAIERRFQPVIVAEPSREVAIEILRHLKQGYERHHGVKIEDEAIVAAVDLSQKMIRERFLPDKAMDLIDEAASKAAIDGFLGHRAAIGAIGEASATALARVSKEKSDMEGELGHLRSLEKTYKDDVAIESAERVIEDHVQELGREEQDLRSSTGSVMVTAEDIRKVIGDWKEYYDAADKKRLE